LSLAYPLFYLSIPITSVTVHTGDMGNGRAAEGFPADLLAGEGLAEVSRRVSNSGPPDKSSLEVSGLEIGLRGAEPSLRSGTPHASAPDRQRSNKMRSLMQDCLGCAIYNLTVHRRKDCRWGVESSRISSDMLANRSSAMGSVEDEQSWSVTRRDFLKTTGAIAGAVGRARRFREMAPSGRSMEPSAAARAITG
jgi:hypothetical protein